MAVIRIRATAPWKSSDAAYVNFESNMAFRGSMDYQISTEQQCDIEKCLGCSLPKCINCLGGGKQGRVGKPGALRAEPKLKQGRGRPKREVKA